MIKKLRRKFVIINMLLVSIILLVVFIGIVAFQKLSMGRQGIMVLQMALDDPEGNIFPNIRLGEDAPEGFTTDPVFVVDLDNEGNTSLVSAKNIDVDTESLQKIALETMNEEQDTGVLKIYGLRYLARANGDGTHRLAYMSIAAEEAMISFMMLAAGLACLGAFVAFLLVSIFLARWALKPVQKTWEGQKRFVADASHELKTPLTVIMANTGILKPTASPEQTGWLESTEQEAKRMKGLVDNLLFLAKSDDKGVQASADTVNLSDIVTNIVLTHESRAFERDITVDTQVEQSLVVRGNKMHMEQLVGILMDNAIKYAEPATEIRVALRESYGQADLRVTDFGQVIPEADIPHIFDRFYRADFSRAQEGYGLGLAIAKTVVDAHKGIIEVKSSVTRGTTFTVMIPMQYGKQ